MCRRRFGRQRLGKNCCASVRAEIRLTRMPLQYRIAGNFRIFRMKASVCENKKCEIYANASTRTYVSTRGLN